MRPLLVAGPLLLALLAGCTSPASDPVPVATADGPPEEAAGLTAPAAGWKVGDHFATEMTSHVRGTMVMREDGEVLLAEEMDELEESGPGRDILVRAVDWAFDDEPHFGVHLRVPLAGAEAAQLVPLRQADLRPTGVSYDDWGLDEEAPMVLHEGMDQHPWIRFPLVPGDTWNGSIEIPGSGAAVEVSSEVLEPSVVDTRLGPMNVIMVQHRYDGLIDVFIDELREELRQEDPDATVAFEGDFTYTLTWAPQIDAIVAAVAREQGVLDAQWTSDGSELSMSMDATWTLTETLTHRDHHAVDPIPQAAFVEAMAKQALEKDPVTYGLEIGPLPDPALVGDAFDAVAVVDAEGTPPAPVRVVTEVIAPDGSTVAEGGDAVAVVLDEVGWYVVTATAYVEDAPVAWAAETVPAATVGQAALECPTATQPEGCTAQPFPVTRWAGAVGAVLQASDDGPLGSALVLADAAGSRHESPVEDGAAEIMLEDLRGLTRDGRDWTAAYNTTMELAPEAEVVWAVLPDDAAVPDVTPPPGEDPLATAFRMRLRPLLWDAPDTATLLTGRATL